MVDDSGRELYVIRAVHHKTVATSEPANLILTKEDYKLVTKYVAR